MPAQTCSQACGDQPLGGTAGVARRLLVIDHPRPWPAKINPVLPLSSAWHERLQLWSEQKESWSLLARHAPGETPSLHVFEWGLGGRRIDLAEQDRLLETEPGPGERQPRLLVCTHGSRDGCCGTLGIPLVRELRALGLEVWEVSHLGGHRFAPTLWSMPDWRVYGRVPTGAGLPAWVERWRSGSELASLRGNAAYSGPLQLVEKALRERRGLWPESLELVEDRVRVIWPGGVEESWRARWELRSYLGPQSCRDLPDGLSEARLPVLLELEPEGVGTPTGNWAL